jgi:2-dehydropantoate 2-reductase
MRHAVLGPGGVGGLIGAALARVGGDVVLLVRPGSIESYPGRIRVESVVLGSFDVEVPATPSLKRAIDGLWVTPKATGIEQALTLAPAGNVGDAIVVPLLNGVDHLELLRRSYRRVIAGAIRVESERDPGWVVRQKTPFLRIDLGPGGEAIAAAVRAAGMDCTVRGDDATVLWEKLALLAPFALTTTAAHGPIGEVRADPTSLDLLQRARSEVVAVASAEGVEIDEPALRKMHASVPDSMRSSMQKDVSAGREPELDAIAGPILRGGELHGIDVSATRELAAQVSANR